MSRPPKIQKFERRPPATFVLRGVYYAVDWDRMEPGASFFIKTTARATELTPILRTVRRIAGYELRAHNRCEFGYFGVRVWRLA